MQVFNLKNPITASKIVRVDYDSPMTLAEAQAGKGTVVIMRFEGGSVTRPINFAGLYNPQPGGYYIETADGTTAYMPAATLNALFS